MVDEITTLLQEKLAALEKAFVLETDAAAKFKLKHEIAETKQELAERGVGTTGAATPASGGVSFGNISIGDVKGGVTIQQAGRDIKITKG